jgi:hypothetical protein
VEFWNDLWKKKKKRRGEIRSTKRRGEKAVRAGAWSRSRR